MTFGPLQWWWQRLPSWIADEVRWVFWFRLFGYGLHFRGGTRLRFKVTLLSPGVNA